MDVLRTILIILIVYYSVRFISRLLVPIVLRMFMKRAKRNFQQHFGSFQQQQKPQKEGEVSIDSKPKNKTNSSVTSVGEYVDFEEVED
tara:strand:- start:44 stop:307 length:264 start_codon:yes stop_codon:yes gene_type:complete